MAVDVLVNATTATVTAGGTDAPSALTVQTFTVTAGSTWPTLTTGQQYRIIDYRDLGKTSGYEVMLVTANAIGAGVSWTVTRGAESTTPYAHKANWTCVPEPTAAALANLGTYVSTNVALPTGNATTDTANILAAITATAAGGTIQFGPGTYQVNAQLTYYQQTKWLGSSAGATTIQLTTDLWTSGNGPAYWIVPNGGNSGSSDYPFIMEGIYLHGPGGLTLGKTPNRTTAVKLNNGGILRNMSIDSFFAGAAMWGNHQIIEDSKISDNFYNIDFPDSMPSLGNQSFTNCIFNGPMCACIHIGGSGQWDASYAANIHLGSGPVGIFKTDGQSGWDGNNNPVYAGTASTTSAMTGLVLEAINFESIGNCCIYDASTGGGSTTYGGGSFWRGLGHSINTGNGTTIAPLNAAICQNEWAVVARNCDPASTIDGLEYPFLGGSVGVLYIASGGITYITNTIPTDLLGSGSSFSPCYGGTFFVRLNDATAGGGGNGNAIAFYSFNAAINVGDLVEFVPGSNNNNVRRATGTQPILGVALTAASTGGFINTILIQTDGWASAVNCIGTSQVLSGAALSCNSTTPYLADLATNNPSMPVFGLSSLTGASPTTSASGILLRTAQALPPPYQLYTANALTVSSNAVTVPVTYKYSNITNNAAASVTITLATSGAVDKQAAILSFYDHSAVAQTLTFVNTENGVTSVPTSSLGSTTVPLIMGFVFNSTTTKWHYMGDA